MKLTRRDRTIQKNKKPEDEVDVAITLEEDEVEDFTLRDCHLHLLIESSNLCTPKVDSFIKKIKHGAFPRIKAITAADIQHEAKNRYKYYHANGLMVSNVIKHILKRLKEEDLEETEKLSKGVDTADLYNDEIAHNVVKEAKKIKKKETTKKTYGQAPPQKTQLSPPKKAGKKKKIEADSHFRASTGTSSMKTAFPVESPRFFIIIFGIHDLNLVIEMINLGISVMSVIKVSSCNLEETLTNPFVRKFWKELSQTIELKGKNLSLKDVALIELIIDGLNDTALSTEILKILFNLAESYRHYLDYIRYTEIQMLPQILSPLSLDDMHIYSCLMENIPEEDNLIIAHMLHSIVEQVHSHKETDILNSQKGNSDIISKMYKSLPICQLWNNIRSDEKEQDQLYYGYQMDRLLSCIKHGIGRMTLKTYLHLSALHNMETSYSIPTENLLDNKVCSEINYFKSWPITHNEEHKNMKDNEVTTYESPNKSISLRNTHLLALRKLLLCKDITSLLNTAQVPEKKYNYMECLNVKDMCMLLAKAWSKMNSYVYSHFKPTNDLLIMFYNKHNSRNMWSENWSVDIKTPIGFQSFILYLCKEQSEWLKNYDAKHNIQLYHDEEVMTKKPLTQNQLENMTELREISNTLKCGKLNNMKNISSVKEGTTCQHTDFDDNKTTYDGQVNEFGVNFFSTEPKNDCDFIAYDILPMRVHIMGKNLNFYLANDTRMKVEQNEWSHEGESQIFTEVTKSNHTLSTYTSPTSGELLSVQLTLVSGVIITLFRSALVDQVIAEQISDTKPAKEKRSGKSQKLKGKKKPAKTKKEDGDNKAEKDLKSRIESRRLSTHSYDSKFNINLKLSCPNGLYVETKNKYNMFYIKQVNLMQNKRKNVENYLCFLTNGTIIKFMHDNVEILCSDGSMFICKDDTKVKEFTEGENTNTELSSEIKDIKDFKHIKNEALLWWKKWKPLDFDIIKPWGEHMSSRPKSTIDNLEMKIAVDEESGEVYMKRKDAFTSFLKNDGTLEVSFPDGSVITSSYVIETDDVFCDWTIEEVNTLKLKHLLQNNMREEINNQNSRSYPNKQIVQLKAPEGYVSVHLQCKMVHSSNYAAVEYNNMSREVCISLQDKPIVHMYNNNLCDIYLDDKNTVHASESYVNLKCEDLTVAKFFWENSEENVLCSVTDKDNNSYTVNYDTTIIVDHKNISRLSERHQCFILHKDMTGKRLIHEDDAMEYINYVKAFKGGSVYEYKITGHPYCKLYNMFHPHKGIGESAKISVPKNLTFLDLRKIKTGQHLMWLYSHAMNSKKCDKTDHKFNELFTYKDEPLIVKRVFHKIDGWPEILHSGIKEYIRNSDSILEYFSNIREQAQVSKLKHEDSEYSGEAEKILVENETTESINKK